MQILNVEIIPEEREYLYKDEQGRIAYSSTEPMHAPPNATCVYGLVTKGPGAMVTIHARDAHTAMVGSRIQFADSGPWFYVIGTERIEDTVQLTCQSYPDLEQAATEVTP